MQLNLIDKKKEGAGKKGKAEKNVPSVIQSAKFIMQAKKESDKEAAKKWIL